MTDLNAPLQPNRKPAKAASKSGAKPARARMARPAFIAALLAAPLALNAFSILSMPNFRAEAAITLPAPVHTAATPDADSAPSTAAEVTANSDMQNGVEVVYGTDDDLDEMPEFGMEDDGVAAPVPAARPAPSERRLSPGGPKIISVRDPAAANIGQPVQLAHLPEEAALEPSEAGSLPRITTTGKRPMEIYARPWSPGSGKRIALVIGGIGLSQTGTARALELLPPDVTLAFAPAGNSLNRWMKKARNRGHELLLQVPMEPFGYPEIDLENLHKSLGRLTNYTGVMNYLGGRLATDPDAIAPILDDLAARGLLFLNDGTVSSQLGKLARAEGLAYAEADIVIDASQTRSDIEAQLKALENLAASRGYAVGTGSALALTVETVADWANGAKKRGFEFVGVTAIINASR
jgi:polysaccharide deacetylase 2 family uncharacterized protein YibQ